MDELEQKLKHTRLAVPSAELDRRIDDAVAAARRRRNTSRKAAFWWWTTALATAGSLTALLVVFPRRSFPAPEVEVYRIEAQGRMREMLLGPIINRDAAPQFVFHVNTP